MYIVDFVKVLYIKVTHEFYELKFIILNRKKVKKLINNLTLKYILFYTTSFKHCVSGISTFKVVLEHFFKIKNI